MSDKNTGGNAFPQPATSDGYVTNTYGGMNLRDYFAAKAMQAMISTALVPCLGGLDNFEPITAKAAYKMADAMIAEGEK